MPSLVDTSSVVRIESDLAGDFTLVHGGINLWIGDDIFPPFLRFRTFALNDNDNDNDNDLDNDNDYNNYNDYDYDNDNSEEFSTFVEDHIKDGVAVGVIVVGCTSPPSDRVCKTFATLGAVAINKVDTLTTPNYAMIGRNVSPVCVKSDIFDVEPETDDDDGINPSDDIVQPLGLAMPLLAKPEEPLSLPDFVIVKLVPPWLTDDIDVAVLSLTCRRYYDLLGRRWSTPVQVPDGLAPTLLTFTSKPKAPPAARRHPTNNHATRVRGDFQPAQNTAAWFAAPLHHRSRSGQHSAHSHGQIL
ncbi:hypothetical protein SAMD00019534_073600 [Acytostelium subglobosum LB1]|uniref:hypothetical protein n=1 Tax=Acytostelium subglobosum LB1 TaxID=1410327 RepID=UPI000644EB7A|nr:hypothetical protein SAMD00019534_073600 [Acytostelium subglobosum LB1]GAM24185.1 hypothetical protein SAMD00019534_073600 [Acytostelium subglobosum LB1]|eukprot:XP_012752511.1 hypothetical protein SAMD00019534_073600 [Acytostelium subglobosum LB1]